MTPVLPQTRNDMIAYYRARAGEYDRWFYRQGRYDRGPDNNRKWFAECEDVFQALDRAALQGDVLELACGTGIWTQRLLRHASRITAVDAAPEAIEINRLKVADDRVEYLLADLFAWEPPRRFDAVYFGFWMSHVPMQRLDAFWQMIAAALLPGGKVFFIDSVCSKNSGAIDHQPAVRGQLQHRKLDDGREFQIVKIFYEPTEIIAAAGKAGMQIEVNKTAEYFLYGCGTTPCVNRSAL